jgi:hypothetical protein
VSDEPQPPIGKVEQAQDLEPSEEDAEQVRGGKVALSDIPVVKTTDKPSSK